MWWKQSTSPNSHFFFPAGWWDDRSLKLIPQTSVSSPTMVLCCSVGTLKCSTTTSLSSATSVWAPSLFRWDGQSGWAARLQERRKPGSLLPCSWTHRGCVEMSVYLQQTLSQTSTYISITSPGRIPFPGTSPSNRSQQPVEQPVLYSIRVL